MNLKSYKLNEEGFRQCDRMTEAFMTLVHFIEAMTPECRERSVAMTHLEIASHFAKKAMVHNSDYILKDDSDKQEGNEDSREELGETPGLVGAKS